MSERLKIERRIAVYLASEETTGSPDITPFPERARDIYENFVVPAEKQTRAEVLAACRECVPYHDSICCVQRELARFEKESHAGRVVHGTCEDWCKACPRCCIENLQPAAKALEELLGEEREEALLGIVAWRRDLLEAWRNDSRAWMTVLLEGGPSMDIEKDRAIVEKP